MKMPEVAYAHVIVDPEYFRNFYCREKSPYEIVAEFQRIYNTSFLGKYLQGDTSLLVQGPQDDIEGLCDCYSGSHLVESLILHLFYESRKKSGVVEKEMSPKEALLLLGTLTSPEINPWEYLRIYDPDEYKKAILV